MSMRIRTSRAKQTDLAYSISRSVWSSIGPPPRASTCQSPVSPGLTSCRSCCQGWYFATTDRSSGRGPIRLICPLTTLNSCGSSSRLHRRRKRPMVVCRGSAPDLWVHRRSGNEIGTFALRLSGSMVRNFKTSNELPCMPIRCWRKITLGPRLTRTRSAINAMTRAAAVIKKTDKNLSRQGFQIRTYAPCLLAVVLACGAERLPKPAALMPYSSPLDAMFFTSRHEPHFYSPHVLSLWRETQQARSPLSVLSVRIRLAILLTSACNSLARPPGEHVHMSIKPAAVIPLAGRSIGCSG